MNFVSEELKIFNSNACLPRWQSNAWVCMTMVLLSQLATAFQIPAPSDCSRINHRQYAYQHPNTKKLSSLSVSSVRTHPSWNNTAESSLQTMLLLQELEKELDYQRSKLEEILEESSSNLVVEEDIMWEVPSEWTPSVSSISLSPEVVAPFAATFPPIDSKKSFTLFGDVWNARLLLLASAALYGTNFAFVKLLGETIPSVGVSSTIRFGMATLATLPWLLAPDEDDIDTEEVGQLPPTLEAEKPINGWFQLPFLQSSTNSSATVMNNRHHRDRPFGISSTSMAATLAGFEVGMYNSVGYVAQAVGLECTDASKSAFLCSLAVVIVPIVDFLAGKPLQRKQIIGAAMAVGGVGFLELGGLCSAGGGAGESVQMATANSWNSLSSGDIASLLQPFAFGVGFWRMEDTMRKYPHCAHRTTAAQLLAIFLASALYALLSSDPLPDQSQIVSWLTNPTIFGALFWTGIITTALTIYMETVAMKTLSAAETTLIFSTEPIWGLITASIVMGETFGMNAAMGATLILGGCIFSNIGFGGLSLIGENGKGGDIKGGDGTTSIDIKI